MTSTCTSEHTKLVATSEVDVRLTRISTALVVLGATLCGLALIDEAGRLRFGFAYLWGFSFVWVIVLGSLFFVGLQHLTHAVWSVVVRRIAEMLAAGMWLVALLFIPVLLFGLLTDQFRVFPWTDASLVEHDHLLHGKRAYLNVPFFTLRAVLFFALWIMFTKYFVGTSLRQDRGEGGVAASVAMRKVSAPFVMIFALTMTFASFDWLMSLNPYWFSTIFGVYVFSGMVVSSLGAITLITVVLRDSGRLGHATVGPDHLYNLGVLMFAFVCFWAYIAFSQYMLIWYANIPEEASYFAHRLSGDWLGVSVALAVVRFALPFLILLPRRSKTHPRVLCCVSIIVLCGQLLDLYWIIMPELHQDGPVFGWQDLGPLLLMIGALAYYISRFLARHAPMPVGDPLLEESKRFHL